MRGIDIILAFPYILLAIVIVAYLGPEPAERDDRDRHHQHPTLRPDRARHRAGGVREGLRHGRPRGRRAGDLRIIFDTILPNCLAPIIVQATLGFARPSSTRRR